LIQINVLVRHLRQILTQQFDCVLTDTGTQPGSKSRALAIVFDETAKTLSAQDGRQNFSFTSVSISNVAVNGTTDNISIGIDRSSLGIVWQKYDSTNVVTEYGKCRRSGHPTPTSTY
jgi:hypothetical protein